jgi:hypothetical protein
MTQDFVRTPINVWLPTLISHILFNCYTLWLISHWLIIWGIVIAVMTQPFRVNQLLLFRHKRNVISDEIIQVQTWLLSDYRERLSQIKHRSPCRQSSSLDFFKQNYNHNYPGKTTSPARLPIKRIQILTKLVWSSTRCLRSHFNPLRVTNKIVTCYLERKPFRNSAPLLHQITCCGLQYGKWVPDLWARVQERNVDGGESMFVWNRLSWRFSLVLPEKRQNSTFKIPQLVLPHTFQFIVHHYAANGRCSLLVSPLLNDPQKNINVMANRLIHWLINGLTN